MDRDMSRKLAVFLAFILFLLALLTLVPISWFIGTPSCHSCHETQYPASHLLYRMNYLGYMSICSFAPFSTLILLTISLAMLLTSFKIKFERWKGQYRTLAVTVLLVLAAMTLIPFSGPYKNLLGGSTLDPLVPVSTIVLLVLAVAAFFGFIVCPFLVLMRCRCPVLEDSLDSGQAPDRAILRYLKILLTGKLNDADVEKLYRCTLCNGCWMAAFNRSTRAMAVNRGICPAHLAAIRTSVTTYGNPYGTALAANGGTRNESADTVLFMGCTARYRAPEILQAAEHLLAKKGIVFRTLPDETCCGYTLFNLGDHGSGYQAVDKNIEMFRKAGVKRIITICPGCYSAFNQYYRGRNGFDAEIVLALDLLKDHKVSVPGITVHDPCHAKGKGETVRGMLPGAKENGTGACCGAGGGVMSCDRALAESRAGRILGENPGNLVTYCPFCYLNLSRVDVGRVEDLYVLMDRGDACTDR
ncbi:MAG TPA: (Fe-S)-binding protein [Methanocellaceae archaeon]